METEMSIEIWRKNQSEICNREDQKKQFGRTEQTRIITLMVENKKYILEEAYEVLGTKAVDKNKKWKTNTKIEQKCRQKTRIGLLWSAKTNMELYNTAKK